jgi:uncharacterized SAM-binding protein YcdF (DUF218 family)
MVLTLLTRILVWAAVGWFVWFVLLKFIPRNFLTWFGGAIILALVVLSFIDPNDETIGSIWKIISLPLTPLGASIGLLMTALKDFTFKDGFKKINGRYVAAALTILIVCSVPLFARTIVNQAENAVEEAYRAQQGICEDVCPVEIPTEVPLSQVSAMVVMGDNIDVVVPPEDFPSRVDRGISLNPMLLARLSSAATLYQQLRQNGSSPFVILTAGTALGNDEERAINNQVLQNILVNSGIPLEVIRIERTGMDVYRTLRETRNFLEAQGILGDPQAPQRQSSRIALVAPALTMRRAALTFEEAGLQVIAWPTNLYGGSMPTGDTLARLSDLVPSAEALRLTTLYCNEILTSFYYFLRGWLPGFNVRWNEIVELVPE